MDGNEQEHHYRRASGKVTQLTVLSPPNCFAPALTAKNTWTSTPRSWWCSRSSSLLRWRWRWMSLIVMGEIALATSYGWAYPFILFYLLTMCVRRWRQSLKKTQWVEVRSSQSHSWPREQVSWMQWGSSHLTILISPAFVALQVQIQSSEYGGESSKDFEVVIPQKIFYRAPLSSLFVPYVPRRVSRRNASFKAIWK